MKKSLILVVFLFLIFFFLLFLFKNNSNNILNSLPEVNSFETLPTKNPINIVFSTDKKYKDYLKTALKSSIINKDPNTFYNIHILCIDLPKKEQEKFKSFEEKNVKITIVPLKLRMLDGTIKHRINFHYVSRADFFKIFIPEMFKDYDKILYLDCDILVLKDLSELYNTDIEDKILAVVKRFDFSPKLKKDVYNCGVILFNIKKWQKDNITNKIVDTINNNKKNTTLTQYPFNKVVKDDEILLISPLYNNIIWPKNDFSIEKFKENYSPFADDIKDYEDLSSKTVIAHFAGIQKPWYNPQMEFAPLWWKYAHLVNPDWKVEKRNFFKHFLNSFAILTKFVNSKTLIDYFKNFYIIFKNS